MLWMEDKVLYKIQTFRKIVRTDYDEVVVVVRYLSKYEGSWVESRLKSKPAVFNSIAGNHPDGYISASYMVDGCTHRSNGPAKVIYHKQAGGSFVRNYQYYYLAGEYISASERSFKRHVSKLKRLFKKGGDAL